MEYERLKKALMAGESRKKSLLFTHYGVFFGVS